MKTRIYFLFLILNLGFFANARNLKPRIVGGQDAKPHEFPYLVTIVNANSTEVNCGGAIINSRWILTAGHCLFGYETTDYDIVAGKHDLTKQEIGQQTRHGAKFFIHPDFNPFFVGPGDIGLIYLSEPFEFSNTVSLISLPEKNTIPSGKAIVSGWGSVSLFLSPEFPTKLQTTTVQIMKHEECVKLLKDINYDETNICTGPLKNKKGHCSGDSGTPLVQILNGQPVAIGIASFAYIPCGDEQYPPAFVRVSYFIDWIQETMAQV